MEVKIKLNSELAKMPAYQTSGSSGMDVSSIEECFLLPGARAVISTGLSFEIPEGYEIQVRPRSGLAAKHGITVSNTPATIDADYTGILQIILFNSDKELGFRVNIGDRIAQIIFTPVVQVKLISATELRSTERGANGLGSTGIK